MLLAALGPPSAHRAPAIFAENFFASGGIEAVSAQAGAAATADGLRAEDLASPLDPLAWVTAWQEAEAQLV